MDTTIKEEEEGFCLDLVDRILDRLPKSTYGESLDLATLLCPERSNSYSFIATFPIVYGRITSERRHEKELRKCETCC